MIGVGAGAGGSQTSRAEKVHRYHKDNGNKDGMALMTERGAEKETFKMEEHQITS